MAAGASQRGGVSVADTGIFLELLSDAAGARGEVDEAGDGSMKRLVNFF